MCMGLSGECEGMAAWAGQHTDDALLLQGISAWWLSWLASQ